MTIEDLQAVCRELPAVTEDIKWEHDLVFSVGAKMFFVLGIEGAPVTASFKVTEEEFEEISQRPGFRPAPYFAKHKWVFVDDINFMKRSEWIERIRQSYELVKQKLSKRMKTELGIA